MVKLACRLSGYLINHVFSIKTPTKLHNFCILWRQHNFLGFYADNMVNLNTRVKSMEFIWR